MTTIAYDGRTLAADKQCTDSHGLKTTTTKIWKVRDFLVGGSGDTSAIQEFMHWFKAGADPVAFPAHLRDGDKAQVYVMTIDQERVIRMYENSPFAFIVERRRHVMGSGRDFAAMAMRLGKSAEEAVRLTAEFDSGTGEGVDTLVFD